MTSQKVVCYQMPTSRVKTNLFLTFEIAARWQNVCYTQRYYIDSLNQTTNIVTCMALLFSTAVRTAVLIQSILCTPYIEVLKSGQLDFGLFDYNLIQITTPLTAVQEALWLFCFRI